MRIAMPDPLGLSTSRINAQELRQCATGALTLVELEPPQVVEGDFTAQGYLAKEQVNLSGPMREACPYCEDVPLQLALRSGYVIRTHLYCDNCTRCFDALYSDGSPVFTFPGASIE